MLMLRTFWVAFPFTRRTKACPRDRGREVPLEGRAFRYIRSDFAIPSAHQSHLTT